MATTGIGLAIVASSCGPLPKDYSLKATIEVQAIPKTQVGQPDGMKFTIHNTGADIGKLGILFLTDYGSDKWSAHHTITQSGHCKLQSDGNFECGPLKGGDTTTITVEGTTKDTGKFHYEVTFADVSGSTAYVNFSSKGIESYSWDEQVDPAS